MTFPGKAGQRPDSLTMLGRVGRCSFASDRLVCGGFLNKCILECSVTRDLFKQNENWCPYTIKNTNIHSRLICNSPKLEVNQTPINKCIHNQMMIYSFGGIRRMTVLRK